VKQDRLRSADLTFQPVTLDTWDDMQRLFGEPGAQNGCWCMYWRQTRAEYREGFGERNRQAMAQIIASGKVPGILAYHNGHPIGWCSIAPREDFGSLERSRTLKRIDDKPVWSIVCFAISRPYRGRGVSRALIDAAIDYARENGAAIVEAYPLTPEAARDAPYDQYMGIMSTLEAAGFREVARRSDRRAILRYYIGAGESADGPDDAQP